MKQTVRPEPRFWAWLAHAASLGCALVLALLPASRYVWMEDLAAGVDPSLLEDGAGNRLVFTAACVVLAVLLQALALWRGVRGRHAQVAAAAALVLPVWWVLKFA